MYKHILLGMSAVLLVACGGPGSEGKSATDTPETDVAADDSPLLDYLPWDATLDSVQTTESGLQYVILREGPEDGAMPTREDQVEVMYEGRLPDGTVFDSSYARGAPATFGVGQVISGWTEGLQLMSEGDEFVFYIPNGLAYGNQNRGDVIKAGDDLVFRVELLGIEKPPEPRPTADEAWATHTPWDSDHPDVQSLDNGVEYVVLGSGAEDGSKPTEENIVVLWYEGRIAESGETFDSAYERAEPSLVMTGEFLPGMITAVTAMRPGDHWLVYIPSDQAFGSEGFRTIPPDTDLMFEFELVDVLSVN